jgi:NADH:ubiquinone oxidoreductase subunit 3 (subunit A)
VKWYWIVLIVAVVLVAANYGLGTLLAARRLAPLQAQQTAWASDPSRFASGVVPSGGQWTELA